MARVLVFRHVPFEHLGLIAPALESRGIEYQYVDLWKDPEQDLPFSVHESAGIISMGGPMSANDDQDFLRQELRYVAQAITRSRPILGVCLGSQLLAKAMGAKVYRNRVKEIGWYPVSFTPAAQDDTLFAGLNQPETIFHWHGETFDLPRNAVHLASSEACAHQAFRLGDAWYGLQFHLEVTPGMIAGWLTEDANEGDVREVHHSIDPHAHASRMFELAALVFGRWADLVIRR